jgi:hypothetical protein
MKKIYGFRKFVPRQPFFAKLDGPLMSMGASGSIGGILTFGSNKGRNFVRQLVIPANPKTPAQSGVRSMMKWAGSEWRQLTDTDQATWESKAAQTNISPFNAFVSQAMDNWSNAKAGQRQDPAETVTTPSGPPTAITATVIERRATIDWTDEVIGSDPFGVIYYQSQTTGFTPGRDNAVAVIDFGVLSYNTQTLTPGTYFFRMASFDVAGNISAVSAQQSFVIA